MSALDQSLDEILASKPKKQIRKKHTVNAKVAKRVPRRTVSKAVVQKPLKKAPSTTVDVSHATKVIVSGLPKVTKADEVKEFFASEVGGVQTVSLTYNEKGQSKGIATVIFKSAANANKAVQIYQGAPLDGGASRLKLELIVNPSKVPLSARIQANTIGEAPTKETKGKGNGKQAKPATKVSRVGGRKVRSKRPGKKTIEQLDQEMADYFDKKE